MLLKGYIKAFKEYSFTIPVYGDEEYLYYHILDEEFKIKGFYKAENIEVYFKSLYLSKRFEIGGIGAIVFIGDESFISYNEANKNIDEIINYLTDTTPQTKYLNIKKETLELRQILFQKKTEEMVLLSSTGNVKTIELKDNPTYININYDKFDNVVKLSLEEYMEKENYIYSGNQITSFKENIIRKYIEKSISDNSLYGINKEVMLSLFIKYLDNNKPAFEQIILDTNIGDDFSSYLSSINNVTISPIEMSIEETLKMRADHRRKNLKLFNYYFHKSPSYIEEMSKIPAYKRLGVELTELPLSSEHIWPKMIISMESKDFKAEEAKVTEESKVTKTE